MYETYSRNLRDKWASEVSTCSSSGTTREENLVIQNFRLELSGLDRIHEKACLWLEPRMEQVDLEIDERKFQKQAIIKLFESGQPQFFSEIAEKLDIDLRAVVEICKELIREEKVYVQKNPSK